MTGESVGGEKDMHTLPLLRGLYVCGGTVSLDLAHVASPAADGLVDQIRACAVISAIGGRGRHWSGFCCGLRSSGGLRPGGGLRHFELEDLDVGGFSDRVDRVCRA